MTSLPTTDRKWGTGTFIQVVVARIGEVNGVDLEWEVGEGVTILLTKLLHEISLKVIPVESPFESPPTKKLKPLGTNRHFWKIYVLFSKISYLGFL